MKTILIFCCCLLLTVSCSEEQDFNQVDDLSLQPSLASSLLYFESNEDTMNAAGTGVFFSEVFTFEAFKEKFIADEVVEGTITYQIENTTSKRLGLLIEFLNEADVVLYQEPFAIEPQPTAALERQVNFGPNGESLEILRNTAKIRISATNEGDGSSQSTLTDPKLVFKSSATVVLNVE